MRWATPSWPRTWPRRRWWPPWAGWTGCASPTRFGPWLAGIGRNLCRRRLRERGRERVGALWSWAAVQGGLASDWAATALGPAELAEAGEDARRVRQEIAALPAGQRQAVWLHYLAGPEHSPTGQSGVGGPGGLSQVETAERAGTSVGAVKVRLHKARRRLRARLGPWWEEEHMPVEQVTPWVQMRVGDVRRGLAGDGLPERYVVLLAEVGGQRALPIWVGAFEGTALALSVAGAELPRPGTHRLAAGLLAAAGASLPEVRVTRLAEGTFYAEVLVDGPGGQGPVDARPSDAIALALETGAPILVREAVLTDAAAAPAALGRRLEDLPEGAAEIAAERQAEWARTMASIAAAREQAAPPGAQPGSAPPGPPTPD
jgi:RNA polymerase sigma factor (sigma-70 family)